MSFLVFAYRKLALKRQIGEKEFRQLTISQQKQTMSDRIGVIQQGISSAKNIFTAMSQLSSDTAQMNASNRIQVAGITDDQKMIIQKQFYAETFALAQRASIGNSIFEAASQAQMKELKSKESQMDSEMANLESQIKLLRPELESVEKGETDAAKSDSPKFGLG